MQDPINQTGVNLIYQTSDQTNQIGKSVKKKKLPNFGHCPNHGGGGLSKDKLFSYMNVWTYL